MSVPLFIQRVTKKTCFDENIEVKKLLCKSNLTSTLCCAAGSSNSSQNFKYDDESTDSEFGRSFMAIDFYSMDK